MDKQLQEQQSNKLQDRSRRFKQLPWKRLIFFIIAVILIAVGAIIWILNSNSKAPWPNVLYVIFVALGIVVVLLQWLFPVSNGKPEQHIVSAPPQSISLQAPFTDTNENSNNVKPPLPADPSPRQQFEKPTANPSSIFQINVKLTSRNDFYGRETIRETLITRARKAAPTSIVGPRRIGKTWLIAYLLLTAPTNRLGPRYRVGYIDASTPICSTVVGFTERVLEEFGISHSHTDKSSLNLATLERCVRNLRNNNQIPILCIDEFEGFAKSQEFDLSFFEGLRAIASEGGLGLVTASKTPLIEIVSGQTKTSPFFNIFEQLKLQPFNAEEAKEFVQAKSKKANFNDQEQQFLLRYGQIGQLEWSPLRLQLAGKMLLEDKNQQQYRSDDQSYERYFEDRLNAAYRGVVP